jgi:taurine dioxygenase
VAYASLQEELKRKIDGLQVLNVFPNDQKRRNRLDELGPSDPRCEHPLLQLDAVTGEPFLYLCEMQVDRLVGLPEDESEALIKQMLDIMLSDQCVYRHSWHANDCVVWDNLSVQHGRPDVEHAGSRTLRRTSSGTKGFLEQAPQYGYDPETGIVQAQA